MIKRLVLVTAVMTLGLSGLFGASASAAPVCPDGVAAVTSYSFELKGTDGVVRHASRLSNGDLLPGDEVTAVFELADGCEDIEMSLASYRAPTNPYQYNLAHLQELYDSDTGLFDAGVENRLTVNLPVPPGSAGVGCTNKHLNGPLTKNKGANTSGAYDSTCDGSPSQNGKGGGKANGKPCAGCVGNADNKNPPGQKPNGSDPNAGYECDRNQGVGKTNPAHSGCTLNRFAQVDFVRGAVLPTLGPPGTNNYYSDQNRLINAGTV